MKRVQECPDAKQLEGFVLAKLSDDAMEAIAAHVATCATCRLGVEADATLAAQDDDLRWANKLRDQTQLDVSVPLARLNELLTDYELVREIGRGGMGIVFEARQIKLDRVVALKVLPALLGAVRPDAVARFRREAELAAGLQHTSIIPVYEFGEVDGTWFYTMQLIAGRSLRQILEQIKETRAIDVVLGQHDGSDGATRTRLGSSSKSDQAYFRRAAEWIADVASALHYAHERGVIHRDVKPSNLLLNTDGSLMISDFGLAKACGVDTLTGSHALVGTVRYMAPEQLDEPAETIDRRIDVYALGATLYELLAFRPMFAAADDRELVHHVLNREPSPPRRWVRQVPGELEVICLKAIEKDRTRRYATAQAFADDLRRWLLDLPIHAKRPSLPARAVKLIRRRKLTSSLVASLVLMLAASTVLYANYFRARSDASRTAVLARSAQLEALLLNADFDLREGRLDAALAKMTDALRLDPDSLDVRRRHAQALWALGREEEAIALLNDVLASDPDCWQAHAKLARMYRDWGDDGEVRYHQEQLMRLMPDSSEAYFLQACEQSDPRKAIELLNKAIELGPPQVQLYFERSFKHYALREYDAMLLDAQRAVGMFDRWAPAHAQVGLALCSMGRCEEAKRAYGRAIEREPRSPLWWRNRAVTKYKMGRYAESIADASEAIRLDSDYARAYVIRGRARAGLGDLSAALADYDRAIALDSTDIENLLSRGFVYSQAGRWEDQITDCTLVLELVPDERRAYSNRALAHMQLKQYDAAIVDLSNLVRLMPENVRVYRTRGEAYGHLERYDEAIADFTHAMQLEPGWAEDFHNRASCTWRAGRYEESAADWTVLIQMGLNAPQNHHHRGLCYLRSGQYARAVADFTRVVDLSPNEPVSFQTRGAAYIWMQRFEEAIADFSRALDVAPHDAATRMRRGMAYELSGETKRAIADYEAVAARGGANGTYAKLWQYIALRRSGDDESAAEVLASFAPAESEQAWTDRISLLFAGQLPVDELFAAATTDDERAEAFYYIGMKSMLDGHRESANDALEKCVALNRTKVLETDFARARLTVRQQSTAATH